MEKSPETSIPDSGVVFPSLQAQADILSSDRGQLNKNNEHGSNFHIFIFVTKYR